MTRTTPPVPRQGHAANRHRRYAIADQHFGHRFVLELRGLTDAEHKDRFRGWVYDLPPGCTVVLAGDLSAGGRAGFGAALEFLQTLTERVHFELVPGNHDPIHALHGPSAINAQRVFAAELARTFWHVGERRLVKDGGGGQVQVNHFPAHGDHTDTERYGIWRPHMAEGLPLVHGHTHQEAPTVPERPGHVCVSEDAWDRIPSLVECAALARW